MFIIYLAFITDAFRKKFIQTLKQHLNKYISCFTSPTFWQIKLLYALKAVLKKK